MLLGNFFTIADKMLKWGTSHTLLNRETLREYSCMNRDEMHSSTLVDIIPINFYPALAYPEIKRHSHKFLQLSVPCFFLYMHITSSFKETFDAQHVAAPETVKPGLYAMNYT
jgi:hypothetical protein